MAAAGRPPSVDVSGTYRLGSASVVAAGGLTKVERLRAPAGGPTAAGDWLRDVARGPSSGWFGVTGDPPPGTVAG
jgi:hypothetical protein